MVERNKDGSLPFRNALWIAYVREKKSRRKKNDAQPIDDFQININRDKQVNQKSVFDVVVNISYILITFNKKNHSVLLTKDMGALLNLVIILHGGILYVQGEHKVGKTPF